MLAKRIIPCLDVNNGRVVKGVNFVKLVYVVRGFSCAVILFIRAFKAFKLFFVFYSVAVPAL